MTGRNTLRLVAASAVVLAAGGVEATVISGSVSWTDSLGGTHASRRTQVFIVEENPFDPSPHVVAADVDLDGGFSHDFSFRPGASGYAILPAAMNEAVFVSSDGTVANTYRGFFFHSGTSVPAGGLPIVTPYGSTINSALSIADGMYTTWWFGRSARADVSGPAPVAPPQIPAVYPTSAATTQWTGAVIDVLAGDEDDWDVVGHEYAHYLGDMAPDHLQAIGVGGAHAAGVSSIPSRGKSIGIRLGWQEGYASWAGVAAQSFDSAAQHMPAAVPYVGDARYTDTVDQELFHDLESELGDNATRGNSGGEGDENSVNRILWDLGDPANEAHDRVAMGHGPLMSQLRHIAVDAPGGGTRGVETLNELWRSLSGQDGHTTVTYPEVVDYGAIFQKYNVSPEPLSGNMGAFVTGPAPTFEWLRGNGGQNDDFRLIILDVALDDIVMEIDTGNVTTYTLDSAQWAYFAATPGEYQYVVAGNDLVSGFPAEEATGLYWSDAYDFSIMIPTPGVLALAVTGLGLVVRRRRA